MKRIAWLVLMVATACGSQPRQEPAPPPDEPAVQQPPEAAPPSATLPPWRQVRELETTAGPKVLVVPVDSTSVTADVAHVRLTLPVGALDGKPGLAELTAEAVAAAASRLREQPSLRDRVHGLGGELDIEIGPESTSFSIAVPATRWPDAVQALGDAMRRRTASRAQLEDIQAAMLLQGTQRIRKEPVLTLATRLALGDQGPADHLGALQDRDPTEVLLFRRRRYRPERAVLALRVPGDDERVAEQCSVAFAGWQAAEEAEEAEGERRRGGLRSALHWVPWPVDACQLVVIFALPDALGPEAAALQTLQECVTMAGVGGRLERAMILDEGSDPRWRNRRLTLGGTRLLILDGQIEAATVPAVWQTLLSVRNSLRSSPPTASEIRAGAARALLVLAAERAEPGDQLHFAARCAMGEGREDPFDAHVKELSEPRASKVASKVEEYLKLPMALVAIGGEIPAEVADVVVPIELLPSGPSLHRGDGDLTAQFAAAEPVLAAAMAAVGGRDKLAALAGYTAASVTRGNSGPMLEEDWNVTGPAQIARQQRVLSTVIDTTITGDRGVEKSGEQTTPLSVPDITHVVRQAHRNPVSLLASHAQGRLRFRLVSVRRIEDRDMVILEADTLLYERLRIHIDAGSNLIRRIESWESQGTQGPVYLREEFSDYETVAGLRVPMRRITDIDDGAARTETTWSKFEPRLR